MKKIISLLTVAVLFLCALTGCGGEKQAVATDGSTSMNKVIGSLSEAFEADTGITVTYNATGSGELLEEGTVKKATGEHSYGEWKVVKEATKTAKGEKQRTCSVCSHVDSEKIPMLLDIPQTDDDSNVMLYSAILIMALAALTVLLLDSGKRKKANK